MRLPLGNFSASHWPCIFPGAIWRAVWRSSFDWFLGSNALRLPVYDATTGGCRDGLHENRVNRNQGAESTLSFLIALAEMRSNSTHRSQK